MEKSVLLTIAIPTYNRAQHLRQQLERLIPVLPSDAEICVLDNYATDETQEVVKAFQERCKALRVRRNSSNFGAGVNFLKCIEEAHGKYVWIVGDDTNVDWAKLDLITQQLKSKPAKGFFICNPDNVPWLSKMETIDDLRLFYADGHFRGDFHYLGNYIFDCREANLFLRDAYQTVAWEHPYVVIAYSLLVRRYPLRIFPCNVFDNTSVSLDECKFRTLPRWNVARSHIGAWRTSLAGCGGDVSLRRFVSRGEEAFRWKTIAASIIRDLVGVAPSGVGDLWLFLFTSGSLLRLPLWIMLRLLWMFRHAAGFMALIFAGYFILNKKDRRIISYYLPEAGKIGFHRALKISCRARSRDPRFEQFNSY